MRTGHRWFVEEPSSRAFARMTGSLYLVIAATGFFSIVWVPSQLTVANDPAATAALISAQTGLFAAGIGGDVVMMTAEVIVSVMLYTMFRPFGSTAALAAMVARLMMAAVMAAMLLMQAGILALVAPDPPIVGFDDGQQAELAWILRRCHDAGVWIWQVFFTLHLWLLGMLAWRSKIVPRLLATGLVVGGTGYFVDSVRAFVLPHSSFLIIAATALLAVVTVAEIGLAIWLIVCGRTDVENRLRPIAGGHSA